MPASIWKQQIEVADFQPIEIPESADILSVNDQANEVCIWFSVPDVSEAKTQRTLRIIGTGHPVDDGEFEEMRFIGTFGLNGWMNVYHLYEVLV